MKARARLLAGELEGGQRRHLGLFPVSEDGWSRPSLVSVASLQVGKGWASLLGAGLQEEAGHWGVVLKGPLAGSDV